MTAPIYTHPDIDADAVVVALEKDGFELRPVVPLRRTLLDTFDGRLHAAGLRLEFRETPNGEQVLTGDGATPARLPLARPPRCGPDIPGGPMRARLAPVLDVRRRWRIGN